MFISCRNIILYLSFQLLCREQNNNQLHKYKMGVTKKIQ